jgi:ABC-type antimicrobial peptide transport system permease subunit
VTPEPYIQHSDVLTSSTLGPFRASWAPSISRLHDVAAVAGALVLTDIKTTLPAEGSPPPSSFEPPTQISVVGVDLTQADLGPISAAKLVAGRSFAASDTHGDVALVDSSYAAGHGLQVGSTVTIAKTPFRIIGIVRQTESSAPPSVYLPLGRAQTLAQLGGYLNTVFVQATSAADVGRVSDEISRLLPRATVTSAATLAKEVTGSLATTASLATRLGTWLAAMALAAAFAVASLLTLAAVSRRVREFGTLKALGWRSRRITAQVLGESLVTGLVGAALGIALGLGGSWLATAAAPKLFATVQETNIGKGGGFGSGLGANGGVFSGVVGGPVQTFANPSATHTVAIPFSAPVTVAVILVAVLLALAGGLLAGSVGGWRVARLRPAAAMARVE